MSPHLADPRARDRTHRHGFAGCVSVECHRARGPQPAAGWLTTTGVTGGETITVVFAVFDLSDSILDSYVCLDDFEWGCEPMGGPSTQPEGIAPLRSRTERVERSSLASPPLRAPGDP